LAAASGRIVSLLTTGLVATLARPLFAFAARRARRPIFRSR